MVEKCLLPMIDFKCFSDFPTDVLEEMATMSFNNFNNINGTYQQIIPKIAHYLIFDNQTQVLTQ